MHTVAGCYFLVYSWIRSELWRFERDASELFVSPRTSATCVSSLDRCIAQQQTEIEGIFTLIETQMPYMLAHLASVSAKIQLLVVALWAGEYIRFGYDQEAYATIAFGIVIVLFVNLVVEGMLQVTEQMTIDSTIRLLLPQVHTALFNPFGYDAVDFPLHLYVRSVVTLSDELINKVFNLVFSS